MEKILVSLCLMGEPVRYNGKDELCSHKIFQKWIKENRLVSICPEVSAGLSVPRPSCEIIGEGGGVKVLQKVAKVISHNRIDRTEAFLKGAYNALRLANQYNIKIALLKKYSPSCGNNEIYNGTYSHKLINGSGVTAALLKINKIIVFNESEIEAANNYLMQLEEN